MITLLASPFVRVAGRSPGEFIRGGAVVQSVFCQGEELKSSSELSMRMVGLAQPSLALRPLMLSAVLPRCT